MPINNNRVGPDINRPLTSEPEPQDEPPQNQASNNTSANTSTQTTPRPITGRDIEQQVQQTPLPSLGKTKMSAADAERLVSQAGFQRAKKKGAKGNFDIGDSSNVPIPLPVEEVDEEGWSQQSLDDAQEKMTLQGGLLAGVLKEMEAGGDEIEFFARVLGHTFAPDEEGVAQLQALADSKSDAEGLDLTTVQANVGTVLGQELSNVSPGQLLLGTSLVVAGRSDAVLPAPDGLQANALAGGAKTLAQDGSSAVADARAMGQGINKELAIRRTFVFKR